MSSNGNDQPGDSPGDGRGAGSRLTDADTKQERTRGGVEHGSTNRPRGEGGFCPTFYLTTERGFLNRVLIDSESPEDGSESPEDGSEGPGDEHDRFSDITDCDNE